MKRINIILIAVLSFIYTASYAQKSDFCGAKNTSFKAGEELTFKVYYNVSMVWIGAGEAKFTTKLEDLNGTKVYHITGDGKTYASYDPFYKVRDRYETFIDTATMLPKKFIRNVNEGGMKIYKNVTFDRNRGRALTTKGIYNVPACVQDVLSAIYYARNIDYSKYKPGDTIPFDMFLDEKVYHLYIRYLGKEQIKTKYATFNAIKISPLLIDGTVFSGGEKMTIWVSDDANHLPVRVDSPIVVGSVKVDLIGYKNLRNPLSSLIKLR